MNNFSANSLIKIKETIALVWRKHPFALPVAALALWLIVFLLDQGVGFGLLVIAILSVLMFFFFWKYFTRESLACYLFFVVLGIHVAAVLFIHYAQFQPFSGGIGDYTVYHQEARGVAEGLMRGDFSVLGGLPSSAPDLAVPHYYGRIIGVLYAFTLPKMVVGQLLGAWLGALSSLLMYGVARKLGFSKLWGFVVGLGISIYPSYLFYGSLLLRDVFVVPLVLGGIMLALALFSKFSWKQFFLFYCIAAVLVMFMFYIGYALIFAFLISWFSIAVSGFKKRILLGGLFVLLLLGPLPEVSANQGFFGWSSFKTYLNRNVIVFIREEAYVYQEPSPAPISISTPTPIPIPSSSLTPLPTSAVSSQTGRPLATPIPLSSVPPVSFPVAISTPQPTPQPTPQTTPQPTSLPATPSISVPPIVKRPFALEAPISIEGIALPASDPRRGEGSTVVVETGLHSPVSFAVNSVKSFTHVFFGPFPWHVKYARHLFGLGETALLYLMYPLIFFGIYAAIKKRKKEMLPLLVFSLMVLGVMTLYTASNFGVITRIRMPAIIILFAFLPLGWQFIWEFYKHKKEIHGRTTI
ncbi:MAG: hypothetical protein HYV77_04275 [Candidatus Wildermuthbacteria bacterium]|nr:hypothetical protein [Candidatus Wildermuthbacteria bacterium]